jgi:hypothetical protein
MHSSVPFQALAAGPHSVATRLLRTSTVPSTRAILCTNCYTIPYTISCKRWFVILISILFSILFFRKRV